PFHSAARAYSRCGVLLPGAGRCYGRPVLSAHPSARARSSRQRPMMMPVVHVAAELGQGGTERAVALLATAAQGPPPQRAVGLDRGGPTDERLRAAGVEVAVFHGDLAAAAAAIAAGGPAVALLNRAGRPEAKWNELIRHLAPGPVLPLEVNHFGW